tara:strand:- start:307 stop:486 length:180 start_codon:yes stop_codon:yes gene_type:complete
MKFRNLFNKPNCIDYKIIRYNVYKDDANRGKKLVANDLFTVLNILENNGYIIEADWEKK